MGGGQIADVDVVPDGGAVGRRVIRAEDAKPLALPQGRLASYLNQQLASGRGLPGAAVRCGARHIEIAQGCVAHGRGGGQVSEHPLGHQLGRAIGVDGLGRRLCGDQLRLRGPINRRGGREHEMADAGLRAGFHENAGLGSVVIVIQQGFRHGHIHAGGSGKMQHGGDLALFQQGSEQRLVSRVALREPALPGNRRRHAGGEIVYDGDFIARLEQIQRHMAAYVASPSGHQQGFTLHGPASFKQVRPDNLPPRDRKDP